MRWERNNHPVCTTTDLFKKMCDRRTRHPPFCKNNVHHDRRPTIADAKLRLAPNRRLSEWSSEQRGPGVFYAPSPDAPKNFRNLVVASSFELDMSSDSLSADAVVFNHCRFDSLSPDAGERSTLSPLNHCRFEDNVDRLPIALFQSEHGDDLPTQPTVLIGCCDGWEASKWSVETLAARLGPEETLLLDGGPAFARMSMGQAFVQMEEYRRYCADNADGDKTPLYVFDAEILNKNFANGVALNAEWSVPRCFSHDAQKEMIGSGFRPLPPAWLLCGCKNSGTPMHCHPSTVAWNALFSGVKLWVLMPPDVEEAALLLGPSCHDGTSEEDAEVFSPTVRTVDGGWSKGEDDPAAQELLPGEKEEEDFDLSALEWFLRVARNSAPNGGQCPVLPPTARIIVQKPGEVVFAPAGWWHVVLNCETCVALSCSLALRRDIDALLPLILREDLEFGLHWLSTLDLSEERRDVILRLGGVS